MAPAPVRRFPRARFRAYHGLDFRAFAPSPDGRQVAFVANTSGNMNLWTLDLDTGRQVQRTSFRRRAVRSVHWSPRGDVLVFAADRDGDENQQLFCLDLNSGWPERLAVHAGAQFFPAVEPFSADGSRFIYAANDRDPAVFDLCEVEVASGQARRVWTPPDGVGMIGLTGRSPDGRQVLVVGLHSNTWQEGFVVDLGTGEGRMLLPAAGERRDQPLAFAPDGRHVYVATDRDREDTGLAVCDLADGSWRYVYAPDAEVADAALSPDGETLAVVENQAGYSRLVWVDAATGVARPAAGVPEGVAHNAVFAPDGRAVYTFVEEPRHPCELYRVERARDAATQLTNSWVAAIDRDQLVAPELVYVTAPDGLRIPTFVYRPHGATAQTPVPAVLSIHGGPEAQEQPGYSYAGTYQSLLAAGIAVVAPNIRGSTGFGREYQMRIHRDWGGGELRDLEAVAGYMAGLDWVRADRMGVFGGSFGGFATLSVVSRLPQFDWAAAVSICGPSNLVSFARSVPPSWKSLMKGWVGDPDEDREMLLERSPITYAHQVRAPLCVLQGKLDPRVVEAESEQMVAAVRASGAEVRYEVFPDEGHGFVKKENAARAFIIVEDFFEEHLLGGVLPSGDPDAPIEGTGP